MVPHYLLYTGFLVFLGAANVATAAKTATGIPTAFKDGDTLVVGGTTIRLHGMDAPESKQPCWYKSGRKYSCGTTATEALKKRVGTAAVVCDVRETDRYGRSIAECFKLPKISGEMSINAWMVLWGYAAAYK